MAEKFTFNPGPPTDAYAFWKDKVPMSMTEFGALAEADRVRAFVVSGMAKGDQLTALFNSIDNALANGQPMDAWKRGIAGVFKDNGWDPIEGYRLDNIFRTNIQSAYSAGRYKQLMEVYESRPFWRYSAINDERTRPVHKALHGRVVRFDDPFWDSFYPPNGYRCRCTVTSLSEKQMEKKGLKAESIKPGQLLEPLDKSQMAVPVMPDKHFSTNAARTYWQADTGRYRADVRQMVLKDFIRACPENFSGACEFAETDCFKTLSRYVSKQDQADLKTLVWADGVTQKTGFTAWVGQALEGKPDAKNYPMGNLPAKVLKAMQEEEVKPRLAMMTVGVAQVKEAKIPAKVMGEASKNLAKARWWMDGQEPGQLVALLPQGQGWLRLMVRLDQEMEAEAGRVTNHLVTAGLVDTDDMGGSGRFKEVR